MIRSCVLAAAACLAVFTSLDAMAADPLPTETHKVLTADLAVEAAQTAVAACKAQGYKVTVVIVDRSGLLQVLVAGDGAGTLTREITRRKAYTAATLRVTTGDFAKRVATPGAFNPSVFDPQLTTAQGGVPIKVGDDTIGAIGAGGAPGGDKDEACANAGLAKIADRLN